MSKSRPAGSPRKFSEKIALLNKKEAEGNAAFERIIKEVEQTTRAPSSLSPYSNYTTASSWSETGPTHPLDDQHFARSPESRLTHYSTVINDHQQYNDKTAYQNLPHQVDSFRSTDHLSVQTPPGLPNIEIFPIDCNQYSPQQQPNSTNYRDDCSNPISAARSLPDIANLKVSSPCQPNFGASSCNDVRLPPTGFQYNNYDTNSNLVTEASPRDGHQYYTAQNDHLNNSTSWQTMAAHQHNPQPSTVQQTLGQNFYEQNHSQMVFPVRSNSTNAVLSNWNHNDTLRTPRMSNNLSKSSEVCYDNYNSNCSYTPNRLGQELRVSNGIVRSNSYNDIQDVSFGSQSKSQFYSQAPQQQQVYVDDSQYQSLG